MKIENLKHNLEEATFSLLKLGRNSCWNKISDNTSYIMSEIKNDTLNAFEKRKKRKKKNDKKVAKSLKQVTIDLKDIYENLYDINLYIYKSEKKKTVVEIQYYLKTSMEYDFFKTIRNNEPMLHSKIALPNYRKNDNEKFDINWELGGIRHKWNSLFRKIRFNKLNSKNVG